LGHAANPRRDGALRGPRDLRDDRAADPPRGGTDHRAGDAGAARQARTAVRARGAESDVAERHLHIRTPSASAAVRRGLHGRPLSISRVMGDCPPPEIESRHRSDRARHRGVWRAEGGVDRPRPAVHRVARYDRLRAPPAPPRHRAREEPAAAPANARQDRALLEDAVGGVSKQDRVRRLRRLSAPARALRAALQLPAPAPGPRRSRTCGPILSRRATRARCYRSAGGRERAARGAGEATAEAVLSRRSPRRPRPQHRGCRRRASRPARRRIPDDSHGEGERR